MMRRTIEKTFRQLTMIAALALLFASVASGQYPAWSGRPASGWLYVVDSNRSSAESAVLMVDSEKGRVIASLPGGFQPDIAVSSDGSRLYLSYSEKENPSEGKLQIIDTASGTILKEFPNRYRWLTTHYLYNSKMALSQDGSLLYLFKMAGSGEAGPDRIEVFDTQLNAFLPNKIDLPECMSPTLLPSAVGDGLYVICRGTQDVRFVGVDRASKTLRPSSTVIDIASSFREGSSSTTSRHREAHYAATGFVDSDTKTLTVITTDGLFLRGDAPSGRIIDRGPLDRTPHEPSLEPGLPISTGWLQDRFVRGQNPVLSPDGKKVYLGLGSARLLHHGSQLLESIAVLDASDLELISTLKPHHTFWSFAINSKGNRLFIVDSDKAAIGVFDANSGKELSNFSGVGTTPVYAVVAP